MTNLVDLSKEDLTQYSDDELSLRVFNEESFYRNRKDVSGLISWLSEIFTFSDTQEQVLIEDIEADLLEEYAS